MVFNMPLSNNGQPQLLNCYKSVNYTRHTIKCNRYFCFNVETSDGWCYYILDDICNFPPIDGKPIIKDV